MSFSTFSLLVGTREAACSAKTQSCPQDALPLHTLPRGSRLTLQVWGLGLPPSFLTNYGNFQIRRQGTKTRSLQALSFLVTLTHLSFSSLKPPPPVPLSLDICPSQNLTFHCPCRPRACPICVFCGSPLSSNPGGGLSGECPGPPPVCPLPQASVSPSANLG